MTLRVSAHAQLGMPTGAGLRRSTRRKEPIREEQAHGPPIVGTQPPRGKLPREAFSQFVIQMNQIRLKQFEAMANGRLM